ncbi:TIGR02221 family CRISPR-associated protein [Thermoflavimicrobium daqui]|uniref:TIGR02221 family CRISPR-associated protein n=1 Tax=Thermoflavimicrobium daqui TaxID=2137476 RepID=UPI00143CF4E4|nr:TIGR02221 family CRISPR-associated protein [Thermoflavimicrobium daqui]
MRIIAIKFLSFLGLHDYTLCTYELKDKSFTSRFVQEALLEILGEEEEETIEVVIFLTDEARESNWEKENKHGKEGLSSILERLQQQNRIIVRDVRVPSKSDEEGIWEVFSIVIDQLKEEDEIIFDITHSFRYQPMLALLILHFAKVAFRTRIRGIFYGNIAASPKGEVPIAPITDLTPFIDLQDWVTNVYAFQESGRAESLYRFVYEKKEELVKQKVPHKEIQKMSTIEKFTNKLYHLTMELETNRGPTIQTMAQKVLASLDHVQSDLPAQFQPIEILLKRIEKKVEPLAHPDVIESGLAAISWCIQHGLVEQAYTMLVEILVTAVCLVKGYSIEEARDYDLREHYISESLKVADLMLRGEKIEYRNPKVKELADKFATNYTQMVNLYSSLKVDRNDLNHAGWVKQPLEEDKFIERLVKPDPNQRDQSNQAGKYLDLMEEIRNYWKENKPE